MADTQRDDGDLATASPDTEIPGRAGEHARAWAEIERLGLDDYVTELEVKGYTLVPPEVTGMTSQFMDRVRERALDLIGERTGTRPDEATGESRRGAATPGLYYSLMQDRVFEELLMNEAGLAMASFMVGEACHLLISILFMNGPGEPMPDSRLQLPLHSGLTGLGVPEPFPADFDMFADVGWALTDFGEEDGGTVFVPGSHLLRRAPLPGEGEDRAVVATCPKGTMIVWHGGTWHGGHPRSRSGLRGLLTYAFGQPFVRPLQPYEYDVTEEMLSRNPPRFATLMGHNYQSGCRYDDLYEFLIKREADKAARYGAPAAPQSP